MAFIFCDGFDHFTEASDRHLRKWDFESTTSGFAVSAGNGQASSASARFTSTTRLGKFVDASTTRELVFGIWWRFSSTSVTTNSPIVRFFSQETTLESQLTYEAGRLGYRDGANVYYVPGPNLQSGNQYYIEGKVLFDQFIGSVEIRVEGETRFLVSNINTADAPIDTVEIGGASVGTYDLDDFYLLNTEGTTFNDFLGPIHIETLFPNGDGATTDWTPSTGPANYQDVDETPPDDDTTYVLSSTVNQVDLYDFTALTTTSGDVLGVVVDTYGRKDGASARSISFAARSGTTQSDDNSPTGLKSIYTFNQHLFETNPDTASAWTISEVNGGQFGMKVYA